MKADALQTLIGLLIASVGVGFVDWRTGLMCLGLGLYLLGAVSLLRKGGP